MEPDRIIIKELAKYLRGREPGEVPAIIRDELASMELDAEISQTDSEISAVRDALEWCRGGELLVFPVQEERDEVTDLLATLNDTSWARDIEEHPSHRHGPGIPIGPNVAQATVPPEATGSPELPVPISNGPGGFR